jgi:hypothetical protein
MWVGASAVNESSVDFGIKAGRNFVEAKDHEWPLYFERLRRNRELSAVTRQLNQLLDHPEHCQLAIDAFKRIGLWHDDAAMPRRLALRAFGRQQESEICGDEVPAQDRLIDEMAHLIEMDEPMAAAGAQLSGLHVKGETEQALERATRSEGD